ncbi:hypothetical protein AB0J86_35975 [Micromonospora sp. NPDC049559]|uniref:hypothetical protein n=1 Tax=Micromonospora sp. NPDC049559 TaxID=3155923 RepID=UPI00341BCA04
MPDWDDLRAELHDGDEDALATERARTQAWVAALHLAEERKRLGLTQRAPNPAGRPAGPGQPKRSRRTVPPVRST